LCGRVEWSDTLSPGRAAKEWLAGVAEKHPGPVECFSEAVEKHSRQVE
jgi:hypothetical protein